MKSCLERLSRGWHPGCWLFFFVFCLSRIWMLSWHDFGWRLGWKSPGFPRWRLNFLAPFWDRQSPNSMVLGCRRGEPRGGCVQSDAAGHRTGGCSGRRAGQRKQNSRWILGPGERNYVFLFWCLWMVCWWLFCPWPALAFCWLQALLPLQKGLKAAEMAREEIQKTMATWLIWRCFTGANHRVFFTIFLFVLLSTSLIVRLELNSYHVYIKYIFVAS